MCQRDLVAALAVQLAKRHGVRDVLALETHISHVLVAGDTAYKIKKAIALPFLDYSTLEARRRCCEEELRLNRRFAPTLYLDVAAIAGPPEAPVVDGPGVPLEYAVRMRAFDQGDLLAARLARDELPAERIDELARVVAAFHASLVPASSGGRFGTPALALAEALENFDAIAPLVSPSQRAGIEGLRRWTLAEFERCEVTIEARRREGRVRECHGDLHLRNAALVDGRVTLFDGIEFSAELRWIDIASEAAFATMDLADRGRDDYAWRFLNGWLEATGDYGAVGVLRFHLVYRAMVRAKVRYLRVGQLEGDGERRGARSEAERYLALARRLAATARGALLVTCGPAGAGKSTLTQALLERVPAIRLRTDVERRRLHGVPAATPSGSPLAAGLYDPVATKRTYAHLATQAERILAAGYTVLLDGTFLQREQRERMRLVAATLRVPFAILDLRVPVPLLRMRVAARAARGDDVSEATLDVLERQLREAEPLDAAEQACAIAVDGALAPSDPAFATLLGTIHALRKVDR